MTYSMELYQHLKLYNPSDDDQRKKRDMIQRFLRDHPDAFERSCQPGHITGSAWIVNADRSKVLLVLHRKLRLWLQPGGHADGETDILQVALREAQEETGLLSIHALTDAIFDVDIHSIPKSQNDNEHLHYDIRYLFEADEHEPLKISEESLDLQWFDFEVCDQLKLDQSIQRMINKMNHIEA